MPIKKENHLKIYVPDRIAILDATEHMLFKVPINCQKYYRMLRKVYSL